MRYPFKQFQELNHCLCDVEHQISVIRDTAHKLCFADEDEKLALFKKLVVACDDLNRFGFKFDVEAIFAKSKTILNSVVLTDKFKKVA